MSKRATVEMGVCRCGRAAGEEHRQGCVYDEAIDDDEREEEDDGE